MRDKSKTNLWFVYIRYNDLSYNMAEKMSELNKTQQAKSEALRDAMADKFDENETREFASKHQNKHWYSDFILLYRMITDDNFKMSNKSRLIIAGTLAYVVMPVDVIPDFIPVVGWLDDIFIIGLAIKTLSNEIEAFKQYGTR